MTPPTTGRERRVARESVRIGFCLGGVFAGLVTSSFFFWQAKLNGWALTSAVLAAGPALLFLLTYWSQMADDIDHPGEDGP